MGTHWELSRVNALLGEKTADKANKSKVHSIQDGAVRRDGPVEPEPEQPGEGDRGLDQGEGRAERRQDVLQGKEVVHQRPHQGQGRARRQELQVKRWANIVGNEGQMDRFPRPGEKD